MASSLQLHFVDINPDVIDALKIAFANHSEISCSVGNILEIAENTVVSPANSDGFMDGGIDRVYTNYFGLGPQTELQLRIAQIPSGLLSIGSSILVPTGNVRIPYMICAPTMEAPGRIPKKNCFFAMASILNTVTRNSEVVKKVFCPALGTGVGHVAPELAAEEMELAYGKWKRKFAI